MADKYTLFQQAVRLRCASNSADRELANALAWPWECGDDDPVFNAVLDSVCEASVYMEKCVVVYDNYLPERFRLLQNALALDREGVTTNNADHRENVRG
jgi:hypothetical protein